MKGLVTVLCKRRQSGDLLGMFNVERSVLNDPLRWEESKARMARSCRERLRDVVFALVTFKEPQI